MVEGSARGEGPIVGTSGLTPWIPQRKGAVQINEAVGKGARTEGLETGECVRTRSNPSFEPLLFLDDFWGRRRGAVSKALSRDAKVSASLL